MQIKNGLPDHVGTKVDSALRRAVRGNQELRAHVTYAMNHHFAEVRIMGSTWICSLALPLSLDEDHMVARIRDVVPAKDHGSREGH